MRFTLALVGLLLCSTVVQARFIGRLDEEGFLIISPIEPFETPGFEVASATGELEQVNPLPEGFDFVASTENFTGFPNGVAFLFARFNSPIVTDDLNTGLRYLGDPSVGDLRLQYGEGVVPTEFPLQIGESQFLSDFQAIRDSLGDNSGGDNSGGDNSGGDNSGGDNSGGDNSGGDNSGGDNSGGDNSGGDNSGGDSSGGAVPEPSSLIVWQLLLLCGCNFLRGRFVQRNLPAC